MDFSKDHWIGIIIICLIFTVLIYGGVKSAKYLPSTSPTNSALTPEQKLAALQTQASGLKAQVDAQTEAKKASIYKGLVSLNISRGADASHEYAILRVASGAKANILVTGWKIASLSSGASVTIPKGTQLYFTDSQNVENNIVLGPGQTAYVSTGLSPNGTSFQINKCSGYLTQFGNYVPGINASCPLARNEDLSKIPKYVSNDKCFDYIDSYPSCKVQTDPLPVTWSPECKNFIMNLSYSSCIAGHKNDKDFYQPEWRIYLKRSQTLWKTEREHIVLYDLNGKIVDEVSY